jgi:uncharacterized protein (DUF3084 family)
VRDEIRMTISAYQTLYESSVAFGMRKALQAEQGKIDVEQKVKELEDEKRQLEQSVLELKAKCEAIEKRESERRAMEERKHAEEIAFLKKTNVQLKVENTNLDSAGRNTKPSEEIKPEIFYAVCGHVSTVCHCNSLVLCNNQ